MFSEIGDSGLPVVERGWDVGEQVLECGNQIGGFGNVYVKGDLSVLVEDGALRCLEEDIVQRIACVLFLLRHLSEVILYIFRFPVGERESVCVEDGTVDNDAISFWGAHRVLWDQRGVYLLCTGVQKGFKW